MTGWEQGIDLLRELCLCTGFRTDGSSGHDPLPDPARALAESMRAAMHDALSEAPAPAPSGAEVLAMDRADAYNATLAKARDRIDDYRNPATAVPRDMHVPEYRQVQRLSETR